MRLGFGLSAQTDPIQFPKVSNRLWFGTSPNCPEACLVERLPRWSSFNLGIATISYLFVEELKDRLFFLKDKVRSLIVSVGLGDRFRLSSLKRSKDGLKKTVEENLSLISAIATSDHELVDFASGIGLKVILNTGDPIEIASYLDIIDPINLIAYLPVKLPDLSVKEMKNYDSWVEKMVGNKRLRSKIEVQFDLLPKRLNLLENLGIAEVILSAPWFSSSIGIQWIRGLNIPDY